MIGKKLFKSSTFFLIYSIVGVVDCIFIVGRLLLHVFPGIYFIMFHEVPPFMAGSVIFGYWEIFTQWPGGAAQV